MPLLSERAVLAALHISSYSGLLTDKDVTEDVNEQYKADKREAGSYKKRLIHPRFFHGVSSAANMAKNVHKLLTLPWEDDGTRILTTAGYITYTNRLRECKYKFEDEVKNFLSHLPECVEEAKVRLGKMFNAEDYLSESDLKSKFGFDVEIKPVPEAGDFRAELSDDQTKAIIKDIEKRSNDRLARAVNDIFERVLELVQNMSKRLKEYSPRNGDQKRQGIIRDTLVYNIHELAEMMPMLNVTNDDRITQLHKQLLDDLVEHSPEILRTDAKARKETITKADAIIRKVEKYLK